MKKFVLLLIVAVSLTVGCNRAAKVEQASKEFNQLPPAVQKVIRTRAVNGEVAEVKKRLRDGHTVYVIHFQDSRRYPEMEVADDGRLVKYEAGTAAMGAPGPMEGVQQGGMTDADPELSALPMGVQKAIIANTPKADVMDIRRREENGRLVYEIEYAGREPRKVIYVTSEGEVVKHAKATEKGATNTTSSTMQK